MTNTTAMRSFRPRSRFTTASAVERLLRKQEE